MIYIYTCIDILVLTQLIDFYRHLGMMSHIEIGYFEEKIGDHFNYW